MNCDMISSKLSAYLDRELPEQEAKAVAAHVAECARCVALLREYSQTEAFLNKSKPIQPSTDFRARFWQKAREEASTGTQAFALRLIARLIPVPLAIAALLLLFTVISTISPLLAASGAPNRGAAVATLAGKTFVGPSGHNILAPMNFTAFCDKCHVMLCACCAEGGMDKCPMKGECSHD